MGLEHALLNKMPWYHKLWFIPVVFIGLFVVGTWSYIKMKFSR